MKTYVNNMNLEIIEGSGTGTIFEIDVTGLKGSPRTSNDGWIYAGRTYYDCIGRIINDIEMTEHDSEQHWMIKYNAENKEFTVQDLQSESGTFARL